MAVENRKGSSLTGLDAAGIKTKDDSHAFGGRSRKQSQFIESDAADSDGSVYRFFRVHSSVRISSLKQTNDAIANGTDYNWGVYQKQADDGTAGAVVSDNVLADAITNAVARLQPAELLTIDPADAEKPLWELLGLSADPNLQYDICATGITVGDGGTIAAELEYIQ